MSVFWWPTSNARPYVDKQILVSVNLLLFAKHWICELRVELDGIFVFAVLTLGRCLDYVGETFVSLCWSHLGNPFQQTKTKVTCRYDADRPTKTNVDSLIRVGDPLL
jgi:hypothetical protein